MNRIKYLLASSAAVLLFSLPAIADLGTTQVDAGPTLQDRDGNGDIIPIPGPGDANADGTVDIDDLLEVLLHWGMRCRPGPCPGDVDGNGVVDIDDLLEVIMSWD